MAAVSRRARCRDGPDHRGFPALAPRAGQATAYWSLLALASAVNFFTDRRWSFARHRTHPTARLGCVALVTVATVVVATLVFDVSNVVVSVKQPSRHEGQLSALG